MRRALALVVGIALVAGLILTVQLAAFAQPTCVGDETGLGHVCVDTSGPGYVWADGAASNPDPLDGYVAVDGNGNLYCSADGDFTPGETQPGCMPG